jgi:hypothetical protein
MAIATRYRAAVLGLIPALALPAAASAASLTPIGVFQNAAHPVQAIMLGLIGATVAAIAVCVMKLRSSAGLSGGSAYLTGLRIGGPLAGFLGAGWTGLVMTFYLANSSAPVPVNIMAAGYTEAMAQIVLGLLAGAVAVIAKWAVDARIDRAVLNA